MNEMLRWLLSLRNRCSPAPQDQAFLRFMRMVLRPVRSH